ncbi:hypothetical protein BJX70DRAFT_396113 [Aspergillus crustosus]
MPMTPIQCDVCQATFTRHEHLVRHARGHTAEKPFTCTQCGKAFARLDVLHRHTQSHVSYGPNGKAGGSRACKECAVGRTRCSRGNPCKRCNERALQCIYPDTPKRKRRQSDADGASSTSNHRRPWLPLDPPRSVSHTTISQQPQVMDTPPTRTSPYNDSQRLDPTAQMMAVNDMISPTYPDITTERGGQDHLALENQILSDNIGSWFQSITSVNWLSPQPVETMFTDHLIDWMSFPNIPPEDVDSRLTHNEVDNGLDRSSCSQRLAEATSVAEIPAIHSAPQSSHLTAAEANSSGSEDTATSSLLSLPPEGTYYVEGSAGRVPFHGRCTSRYSNSNSATVSDISPGGSPLEKTHPAPEVCISDTVYNEACYHIHSGSRAQGPVGNPTEIPSKSDLELVDSITAYEFKCRQVLQVSDVTSPLPCRESLWLHPTVESTGDGNTPVTLTEALEMLFMEKSLPSNLGDLGTAIVIFGICRRNREAGAQHQTELTFWSPNANKQSRPQYSAVAESWPPSSSSLSRWRNSSCDCLDILHWAANSAAARAAGWEHPTILLLHLARLLLLTPMQHIQTLTSALSFSNGSQRSENSFMTARSHVVRWAVHDQYKARLSIVHAGALLWHVRRYSSNSFLEPFGVYAATLVLWAYSISVSFVRQQTLSRDSQNNNTETTVSSALSSAATVDDDQEGSSSDAETTVIQIDRPCDDELVQAYIRLDDNITARMSRVGDICEASAATRILKQGIKLLRGGVQQAFSLGSSNSTTGDISADAVNPGWGIASSFTQSLQSLAMASGNGGLNGLVNGASK